MKAKEKMFLAFLLLLSFLALAGVSSIWFPKSFGLERTWDLATGSFRDRTYLCGILVSEREVKSGLENVFSSKQIASKYEVTLYLRSVFQPVRGGRWMRVLSLSRKLTGLNVIEDTAERERLVMLIRAQADESIRSWYQETLERTAQNGTTNSVEGVDTASRP